MVGSTFTAIFWLEILFKCGVYAVNDAGLNGSLPGESLTTVENRLPLFGCTLPYP